MIRLEVQKGNQSEQRLESFFEQALLKVSREVFQFSFNCIAMIVRQPPAL